MAKESGLRTKLPYSGKKILFLFRVSGVITILNELEKEIERERERKKKKKPAPGWFKAFFQKFQNLM